MQLKFSCIGAGAVEYTLGSSLCRGSTGWCETSKHAEAPSLIETSFGFSRSLGIPRAQPEEVVADGLRMERPGTLYDCMSHIRAQKFWNMW